MLGRVNPDEETIDWRAVCGRTARTVRREERPNPIGRSYPYLRGLVIVRVVLRSHAVMHASCLLAQTLVARTVATLLA